MYGEEQPCVCDCGFDFQPIPYNAIEPHQPFDIAIGHLRYLFGIAFYFCGYFMIGLPTETDDDIKGIASLAQRAYDRAKAAVPPEQLYTEGAAIVPEALDLPCHTGVVLHGSADCAAVSWTLLGMSIAEWSLLAFVGMLVFSFFVLLSLNLLNRKEGRNR